MQPRSEHCLICACLQQNDDAAQVACMELEECLYSMRRLRNQADTQCSARKGRAFTVLQAVTGACLQQNGHATQVACMERKECLCNTRRLCNQVDTNISARKRGHLQADSGACLHHNGNAAQVPCREPTGQASSYSSFSQKGQGLASLVLQADAGCI